MKLVVPFIDSLAPEDARLIALADFLGITSVTLPLASWQGGMEAIRAGAGEDEWCFVVNPDVIRGWIGEDKHLPDLVHLLTSRFPKIFVHAVRPDPFHSRVVAALSDGQLSEAREIQDSDSMYEVSPDAKAICEGFGGLSFGTPDRANDCVFTAGNAQASVCALIAIGGDAMMAAANVRGAEVLFIGSKEVVDLNAKAQGAWLTDYFSRFLPHAMALRHFFGEQCWHHTEPHASIIVDDPLLQANYGFLSFNRLLDLMQQHNFQTTIAFIPYNFRRSSSRIVKMFREHADRLSLCFHGNDHTGAEFAATDGALLNSMLLTAERRIREHTRTTGLECDRVMVFPQGKFSIEAMAALRRHNFDAAVNTVTRPKGKRDDLTVGEIAQPAVLRYAGFPLFLRKSSQDTKEIDIAFNLFFGRPILIVEHHNIFEDPAPLIEVVRRINKLVPGIRWSRVWVAVSNSYLRRRDPDGTIRIRAYARDVRLVNPGQEPARFAVEWNHAENESEVESVLRDGTVIESISADSAGVHVCIELDPGEQTMLAATYRNNRPDSVRFGIRHAARAFMRRRLSEMRDNYLSRNAPLLAAAQSLQKRLQH